MTEAIEKSPWKQWSTAFKDTQKGPTYYDFTPGRIVVMRAAPVQVWQKSASATTTRWYSLRDPELDVASLLREVRLEEVLAAETSPGEKLSPLKTGAYQTRRRLNFRRFLEHIPPEVKDLLADGWSVDTWAYLRLLMTSPLARELAQTKEGATFVFALSRAHGVQGDEYNGRTPAAMKPVGRWISARLRERRKTALARLGFPEAPSTLAVMSKIPRASLGTHSLRLLKAALTHPETAKRCFHAQRLSSTLLSVLRPELLMHLSPALLAALEQADDADGRLTGFSRMVLDAVQMAAEQDVHTRVFSSVSQVRVVHDELAERARNNGRIICGPLPALPIELRSLELGSVVYLSSSEAMTREGQMMRHCLGSLRDHHLLAQHGRFFAFALMEPVRASLAIWRPRGARGWRTYDLKGPMNSPPCEEHGALARSLLSRFEGLPANDLVDELPF